MKEAREHLAVYFGLTPAEQRSNFSPFGVYFAVPGTVNLRQRTFIT